MTTIWRLPRKDRSTKGPMPANDRPAARPGAEVRWRRIVAPLGPLTLIADGGELVGIDLSGGTPPAAEAAGGADDLLDDAAEQLAAYFAGALHAFDLPMRVEGTAFQIAVWQAVAAIPYGETVSYSDIAREVVRPTAQRAVGRTVGLNPLPIVVPCHRVVGSDGRLTGYGGGLPMKERLLALEREQPLLTQR